MTSNLSFVMFFKVQRCYSIRSAVEKFGSSKIPRMYLNFSSDVRATNIEHTMLVDKYYTIFNMDADGECLDLMTKVVLDCSKRERRENLRRYVFNLQGGRFSSCYDSLSS